MLLPRKTIAFAVALSAVCWTAACGDDDDDPLDPEQEVFTAQLTGSAERPTPVTTSATGTAQLSFTDDSEITYTVTVANLSSLPSMAHIHGPAELTEAANIIVTLSPIASVQTGSLVSGTISSTGVATISLDSLKQLFRKGKAYVNVHTATFPNGELRGQIVEQ